MFVEDLDPFFADFGLPCSKGAETFVGILDAPDESLPMGGTAMLSTMYELTVETMDVGRASIKSGDTILVNAIAHTVRAIVAQADGHICVLTLSKV